MSKDRPVYLAGPMSGRPMFNFPMFDAVAAMLRAQGWAVVSPAELDSPAIREAAMASSDGAPMGNVDGEAVTWGMFLARDVAVVADQSAGVMLLPGWEESRGAKLEAFTALQCYLPIWEWLPARCEARDRTPKEIMDRIASGVGF